MAKNKIKEPNAPKVIEIDVAKEIRDATLRNMEFESNLQQDRSDTELAMDRIEAERSKRFARYRGDVQQVIKTVEARRMLWRIMEIGGPYQVTFVPGDPHMSSFNEGRRYVALEVLKIILDADPASYLQMQREHASDIKAEQERKRREMEKTLQ